MERYRKYILYGAIGFIALGISVWFLKRPGLNVERKGDNQYAMWLPKSGWYDTGIWVGAKQTVYLSTSPAGPHQPFKINLGDQTFGTLLGDKGNFERFLYTPDVMKPQKIYLMVSEESTVDSIPVSVIIENKK